jgi:hypothetical protein
MPQCLKPALDRSAGSAVIGHVRGLAAVKANPAHEESLPRFNRFHIFQTQVSWSSLGRFGMGNNRDVALEQEQETGRVAGTAEPIRIIARKENAGQKIILPAVTEVTRNVFRAVERQSEYIMAGVYFR